MKGTDKILIGWVLGLILMAVFVSMVGCTTTDYRSQYHNSSKDSADFYTDDYQCDVEAEQRTANTGFAGNPMIRSGYWNTCMSHRGWRR